MYKTERISVKSKQNEYYVKSKYKKPFMLTMMSIKLQKENKQKKNELLTYSQTKSNDKYFLEKSKAQLQFKTASKRYQQSNDNFNQLRKTETQNRVQTRHFQAYRINMNTQRKDNQNLSNKLKDFKDLRKNSVNIKSQLQEKARQHFKQLSSPKRGGTYTDNREQDLKNFLNQQKSSSNQNQIPNIQNQIKAFLKNQELQRLNLLPDNNNKYLIQSKKTIHTEQIQKPYTTPEKIIAKKFSQQKQKQINQNSLKQKLITQIQQKKHNQNLSQSLKKNENSTYEKKLTQKAQNKTAPNVKQQDKIQSNANIQTKKIQSEIPQIQKNIKIPITNLKQIPKQKQLTKQKVLQPQKKYAFKQIKEDVILSNFVQTQKKYHFKQIKEDVILSNFVQTTNPVSDTKINEIQNEIKGQSKSKEKLFKYQIIKQQFETQLSNIPKIQTSQFKKKETKMNQNEYLTKNTQIKQETNKATGNLKVQKSQFKIKGEAVKKIQNGTSSNKIQNKKVQVFADQIQCIPLQNTPKLSTLLNFPESKPEQKKLQKIQQIKQKKLPNVPNVPNIPNIPKNQKLTSINPINSVTTKQDPKKLQKKQSKNTNIKKEQPLTQQEISNYTQIVFNFIDMIDILGEYMKNGKLFYNDNISFPWQITGYFIYRYFVHMRSNFVKSFEGKGNCFQIKDYIISLQKLKLLSKQTEIVQLIQETKQQQPKIQSCLNSLYEKATSLVKQKKTTLKLTQNYSKDAKKYLSQQYRFLTTQIKTNVNKQKILKPHVIYLMELIFLIQKLQGNFIKQYIDLQDIKNQQAYLNQYTQNIQKLIINY